MAREEEPMSFAFIDAAARAEWSDLDERADRAGREDAAGDGRRGTSGKRAELTKVRKLRKE
jgi:hypothetical protein